MDSQNPHPSPNRVALFGKAFTSDLNNKWAEVIIYENDKIIYVGDTSNAQSYLTESTQQIKLSQDSLILPGFIDTHIHYLIGGLQTLHYNIKYCFSVEELQQQLRELIAGSPNEEWILAFDYVEIMFPGQKAHRKYLDAVCPDKPMVLMKYDYHTYLVNTKALEIAGITKDTKDPPYGVIERDENGELTGCLHELAMDLVKLFFPPTKPEQYMEALKNSGEIFIKEGITSYTDALVNVPYCKYFQEFYSKKEEDLPRGSISVLWDAALEQKIKDWKGDKFTLNELLEIPETEKFKINTVKFLVDGVLENQTAFLEEQYVGSEKNGILNFDKEKLTKCMTLLHKNGIQGHFHCIGDKATNHVLNVLEEVKKTTPLEANVKDPRHYIAHLQLVNKTDFKRFAELNINTNFSPYWFCEDTDTANIEKLLGKERSRHQYPIRHLMDAGCVVSFGSDWPVTSPRPIDGIEIAITRKPIGDEKGQPWCPDQELTVEEAVLVYTRNSAFVSHRETFAGSLEVGKKADIVVLDRDIFECVPTKIHEAKVSMTIVDGKMLLGKLE